MVALHVLRVLCKHQRHMQFDAVVLNFEGLNNLEQFPDFADMCYIKMLLSKFQSPYTEIFRLNIISFDHLL